MAVMGGGPLRQAEASGFEAADALQGVRDEGDVAECGGDLLGERCVGPRAARGLELRPTHRLAIGVGPGPVDTAGGQRDRAGVCHTSRIRHTERHLQHHDVVHARELAERADDLPVEEEDAKPGIARDGVRGAGRWRRLRGGPDGDARTDQRAQDQGEHNPPIMAASAAHVEGGRAAPMS